MCVGTGGLSEEVGRQSQEISSYNRNCSDDQKEKCRKAAKVRRTKESEYFKELENLLPVSKQDQDSEESHFDKISLIRFSIAYLKTREVVNTGYFHSCLENSPFPNVDILSCLDGFTLVLGTDGDVIHASDNITRYLGIRVVDILGQPFSHYVRPWDHQKLKMLTCHKGNKEAENNVEILARVKCLVTERGRMVNLKQASYKSVKISGKTLQMKGSKQGAVFLGMARVVGQGGADRQQTGVFSTKHGMDMRFSETDAWFSTTAGYSPHHLVGTSFYDLVHPQDSKMVQEAFKYLSAHGVCETAPYRLLCGGGGQVWVQTVARVVCRRTRNGQAVVCRHNQISGVFDSGEVLALNQLENLRKTNEIQKNYENQRIIVAGRKTNKTYNLPDGQNMETTEYATRKGIQNPIKSPIPVIINRRQNSDQEINDYNVKFSEGQPNCVTSSLFENSESLHSKPRLGMEFVTQANYPIILEKYEKIMKNAQSSKDTNTFDDADFLKDYHLLEESIHMEDLQQLSPHSGYESVSFDKSEDFLDFMDPVEFEPDCRATRWTNMTLPDTFKRKQHKMKNVRRKDDDSQWHNYLMYSKEGSEVEDCLKTSNEKYKDGKNIEMEKKTCSDDFPENKIRCEMWQNPWTHSAHRTCGASNNQSVRDNMQELKTKQDQLFFSGWPGTGRKRGPYIKSNLGENFKKLRFETNM